MKISNFYLVKKLDNHNSDEVKSVVTLIESFAKSTGIKIVPVGEPIHVIEDLQEVLIIAIGGDGTMIHASKIAVEYNFPVTGINLGHVGFLTDVTPQMVYHHLFEVINGQAVVEERSVLELRMDDNPTGVAINEFSISGIYSDVLVEYWLKVNHWHAGHHRGNGLIVSSATGSTAYALSAGGAIMAPHVRAIQIVPLAALTLSSRPIIIGSNDILEFGISTKDEAGICIKSDGRPLMTIETPRERAIALSIRRHHNPLIMLHSQTWNFFESMTQKLGWNS